MLDSDLKIKGAGGEKGKKLIDAGVETVQQMKKKIENELLTLTQYISGISVKKLKEWRDCEASLGSCPHGIIYYRIAPNPYITKYGADRWEEEIQKSVFMKRFMCITEAVKCIHDQSKKYFEGTAHEDTWYFYYDALKQLTAKSIVEWMKQEGYYERWLIPQLGLNDGTTYAGRPMGNRP